MAYHSVSDEDYNSTKPEFQSVANEEREEASPPEVSIQIPSAKTSTESQVHRRRIYKVPPPLRANMEHVYEPVVLSLGPYHHGRPQFRQVEEFKAKILNRFVSGCAAKDKSFFCNKILERIDEIRSYYEEGSTNEFSDEVLAEMILTDACFILYYMELQDDNVYLPLGMSVVSFMYRDFFMLENQIPLWIIRFLIGLKYDKDEGEALFCKFLSFMNFGDDRLTQIPWDNDNGNEPLHLLEAHRTTLLRQEKATEFISDQPHFLPRILDFRWKRWRRKSSSQSMFKMESRPFYSVTDLKAKGIHFWPSSNCLTDIKFHSYSFYGLLQLPIWFVTNNSMVFFSNMVAFEMSPETDTDCGVISYVNFMKSLLESPRDVKELREKGILFSCLGSDEEVVRMFKQIDTYGADNSGLFLDVKTRIEEHCNSKAKTWMADLIHTYFRSPWTAIALFAATLLLCLTFLQTFYTIHPVKNN
ncbi:hypothetical protein Salat_0970000 [Sesamum alatum]|uniref:Uncharacterized protein n=1 Tax=Sesamum alatum TaxID=300844 RepID=A0AAE2CS19_9LAMI|nr:hypothetical protein Salat_0970000 [Sesamum alatum]